MLGSLRNFGLANRTGTTDFADLDEKTRLIVFEAMVTSAPMGVEPPDVPAIVRDQTPHIWDAAVAVHAMRVELRADHMVSALNEEPSISLFGAALLASKWSDDPALASKPVFVARAFKPRIDDAP
jgi:hypothetical protein